VAGDDRDDDRVARGGLGVLAGQVAVLPRQGAEPGLLKLRRARQPEQFGQRDDGVDARVGPGPVRQHP